MRLLLDTSALIRWHAGSLEQRAVRTVRRAGEVFVSAVTAAEVSIKSSAGKLRLGRTVEEAIKVYGFSQLAFTVQHGDRVAHLPLHHRDPFDRMLIAQAIEEGLTILTSDRRFELYQVNVEWV